MILLDAFCGAGGASRGYADAGFEVIGVDNRRITSYPYEFIQADALQFIRDVIDHKMPVDVIHASPPCQAYSRTKHTHGVQHPELLEETRDLLTEWGGTYVIENVVGAPMFDPIMLCGTQFDLTARDIDGQRLVLQRHRLFESNVELLTPGPCRHARYRQEGYLFAGVYGGGRSDRRNSMRGGYTPALIVKQQLMRINWMSQRDLNQAIPPAYSNFIGKQLINRGTT